MSWGRNPKAHVSVGSVYSKVNNFIRASNQSSFGHSMEPRNIPMEEKNKDEQLIGKLIRKRKQENDAFQKLLKALEGKGQPGLNLPKSKKKN